MKDMKFISGFAVFGFVLSFVSSLFSPHSSFIHKLLFALLFAVIFGVLGFGIKIIFDKFLNDTDGDFSSDFASSPQVAGASAVPQKGQLVDIVIQDEELAPGESSNRFVVGDNHQMLNDTDVRNSSGTTAAPKHEEEAQMVVPNVTQMSSPEEPVITSKEEKSSKEWTAEPGPASNENVNSGFIPMNAAKLTHVDLANDSEEIDTLPDMNNFSFGSSESSSEEDDGNGYEGDSDFEPSYTSSEKAEVPEVKDAGLIAKAISSVLADEKSI